MLGCYMLSLQMPQIILMQNHELSTEIINKCSQKMSSSSYHPKQQSQLNWEKILVGNRQGLAKNALISNHISGRNLNGACSTFSLTLSWQAPIKTVDRALYLKKCYLMGIALLQLRVRNFKLYSYKSLCLQLWKISFLKSQSKNYSMCRRVGDLYWNSACPSLQMGVRKLTQVQTPSLGWKHKIQFNI